MVAGKECCCTADSGSFTLILGYAVCLYFEDNMLTVKCVTAIHTLLIFFNFGLNVSIV